MSWVEQTQEADMGRTSSAWPTHSCEWDTLEMVFIEMLQRGIAPGSKDLALRPSLGRALQECGQSADLGGSREQKGWPGLGRRWPQRLIRAVSDCCVCSLLLLTIIKAFPIGFWLPEGKLAFKKQTKTSRDAWLQYTCIVNHKSLNHVLRSLLQVNFKIPNLWGSSNQNKNNTK